MSTPTADVSVRVGWADDAAGIAEVQVRAWRKEYADLLPAEVVGSRTGLAELVYLVPILMTLAYLAAALAGGLVRAVEIHRSRAGRLEP